jgi:hypothetical protein
MIKDGETVLEITVVKIPDNAGGGYCAEVDPAQRGDGMTIRGALCDLIRKLPSTPWWESLGCDE